ncbi:hypothetical protein [Maricaulis parjimensis]|uniref:hypothetical protein n=1 Tax=Maricaulis parjimensis TaxID=144023 RepID=UPI00193A1E0D|nr:hypothetical protein [Maricaulis parjimensis]
MFRSDVFRAAMALAVTGSAASALVVFTPELRAAGILPEPLPQRELVYTFINITDDLDARQACPLDLDAAKSQVESGLGQTVRPVYSPIADGPDILVHEVEAVHRDGDCEWSSTVLIGGQLDGPHADTPDAALSSLQQASRAARPLLDVHR